MVSRPFHTNNPTNLNSTNQSSVYVDCQTVWQRCLKTIEKEVSEQSFKTWFLPLRPVRLRQHILTIQIPSKYFYEVIEEHFPYIIRKAVLEHLGQAGKLEYSMLKDKAPEIKPSYTETEEGIKVEESTGKRVLQPSLFRTQNKEEYSSKSNSQSNNQSNARANAQTNTHTGAQSKIQKSALAQTPSTEKAFQPQSNQFKQSTQPTKRAFKKEVTYFDEQVEQSGQHRANTFSSAYKRPQDHKVLPHNLNSRYTFESFVEGECNSVALAAARAVAKSPGKNSFHPLILYGGVGLGKTHLAYAIGNRIKEQAPEKRVVYVSADQFANDYIAAVREGQITPFTEQYYHLDVLIVDDIQFLCHKVKTQESFFHIFNHLHSAGKQMIMTSDCPPSQLKGLQERLLSRFKWGAIIDVQLPDLETRKAIIYTKLKGYEAQVSTDVIGFLAQKVTTNVRELEGVITSLLAKSSLAEQAITLDLARQALGAVVAQSSSHELSIEAIEEIVAAFFQVTLEQLKSKTRKKDIATARQFAMYLTNQYTDLPLKAIGYHFGKRDHTTVIHACRAIPKKIEKEESYKKTLDEIIKRIEQMK